MKAYTYPDDKLKRLIAETSQAFFEQNYPPRPAIEGQEILQFSGNQQVNRFLLFQIYQEWNLYLSKIKHPFFDFQHSEVREALQAFQNILSQHIRVERADFKSLLDKAIYNTFRLILQPLDLLTGFFFLNKNHVSLTQFERYAPYFVDFDFVVGSLLAYYQKNQVLEIERTDFVEKAERLAQLFEKRSEQTLDEYRGILFHKLTGIELKSFLESPPHGKSTGAVFSTEELQTLLGPVKQKTDPAESPRERLQQESSAEVQSLKEIEALASKLFKPPADASVAQPQTSIPPTSPPKNSPIPALNPTSPANSTRLVDQFQGQSNTLNNLYNKKAGGSLLTIESIPMHKQFQFVQKVFAGNRKLFKETIDVLNQHQNEDEALQYLKTRILNMPEVNRDEPVVEEFLELVRSRF